MTVAKFSQISLSPSNLAPTDYLVGVTGGNVDYRFSPSQLQPAVSRTILTSDTSYYVATTGSDSNPGTVGSPWLTLQHAVDFLAANVDGGGFNLTIQMADGTYAGCVIKGFPPNFGQYLIHGHSGDGTKVVLQDTAAGADASLQILPRGALAVGDLTFSVTLLASNGCIECDSPGISVNLQGQIIFDSTPVGVAPFSCVSLFSDSGILTGYGNNTPGGCHMTIQGNFVQAFDAQFELGCIIDFDEFSTLTYVSTPTLTAGCIVVAGGADVRMWAIITGTFTGPSWQIDGNSTINIYGVATTLGASLPPVNLSGVTVINDTVHGAFRALYGGAKQISGLPTTTDLSANTWAVFKDTSGGTARLSYNDAGTIKSAVLNGSSGITVGTTTITGGTSGHIVYDNAGVFGEASAFTIVSGQPNVPYASAYQVGGAFFTTTDANNNVFLGPSAGNFGIISGTDNICEGHAAGLVITTGSKNMLMGAFAGAGITTGHDNMAIGVSVLAAESTGQDNVAIGTQALLSQNGVNANTAIGNKAGLLNQAVGIVAVGDRALAGNTTGVNNSALGAASLFTNSVNNFCTAVGNGALESSTADECTALGCSAGLFISTGDKNLCLGFSSGISITTGRANSILGGYAGTSALASAIALSDGDGNLRGDYNVTNASAWTFVGTLNLSAAAVAATVAGNFVADHRLQVTFNGVTYYIPCSTTAW